MFGIVTLTTSLHYAFLPPVGKNKIQTDLPEYDEIFQFEKHPKEKTSSSFPPAQHFIMNIPEVHEP